MYRQIETQARDLIAVWKGASFSNKEIARKLKRSPSTIGRELKRNGLSGGVYSSIRVQIQRDHRQTSAQKAIVPALEASSLKSDS